MYKVKQQHVPALKLKRYKVKIITRILVAVSIFLCVAYRFIWASSSKNIKLKINKGNNTKTILYWTEFLNEDSFVFGTGRIPFEETGCRVTDCVFWNMQNGEPDGLPFEMFDAVLFHGVYTTSYLGVSAMKKPSVRLPHQRYIFFAQEPPAKLGTDLSHLANFFNWTFTYRRDSDIWYPYGWFVDATIPNYDLHNIDKGIPVWLDPQSQNVSFTSIGTNKTRLAAWMVSNCITESKREWYVAELAQYITVDVYGYCGTSYCSSEHCDAMIGRDYKFYLAFENSLCDDYVTEKFFRAMQYNIVPIVYGGAAYGKIAPPMSYIDVKDFNSPAHLAEYLLYLDKNPQEYEKFFWWKPHYISQRAFREPICQLCEMLHDTSLPKKQYADLESWWNVCESPSKYFSGLKYPWKIGEFGRYSQLTVPV